MGKRVVILQSNYIPWRGYFHLIALADEFILYDHVQYTHRDWRNRNRIMTGNGPRWLTIPVGRHAQRDPINMVEAIDDAWRVNHFNTLRHHCGGAPCWPEVGPSLQELYLEGQERNLSRINETFLKTICRWLDIDANITRSTDYRLEQGKTSCLVSLSEQVGAKEYLTGPAAQDYLDVDQFTSAGITVSWMDYSGYPSYPQIHAPPFVPDLSIVDLLANQGFDGARQHMASLGEGPL